MEPKKYIEKKLRIQQEELQVRDSINLRYGENTESVTFSLVHMSDFVVKSPQREEVKAVMHTYWREQNVYISSEFREGENIRVLVYEDNYRIIHDLKFYVSYGFQFVAEPNKIYTVRFIDEGRIGKLIALEMSKTLTMIDDKANKEHIEGFNDRLSSLQYELKVFCAILRYYQGYHNLELSFMKKIQDN